MRAERTLTVWADEAVFTVNSAFCSLIIALCCFYRHSRGGGGVLDEEAGAHQYYEDT